MPRKSTPLPLTLAAPANLDDEHDFIDSSLSLKSPKSPRSPFKFSSKKVPAQSLGEQASMQAADPLPTRTNLPPSQTSPALSTLQQQLGATSSSDERLERERPARGGFFSNYKASKSSSRLQSSDAGRRVTEDSMSRDADRPGVPGKVSSQEPDSTGGSGVDKSVTRRPVGGPSKSDTSLAADESTPATSSSNVIKKNKPKPFSLLGRTKSIRDEQSPREGLSNNRFLEPDRPQTQNPLKTAPLRSENDRSFRDMMSSNVRQRSEDRQPTSARDMSLGRDVKENGRTPSTFSSSFREGSGHAFLNNLKSSATKGAGAIHKGLFGKSSRSGSTTEREVPVDDEHYQLKIINLPLVEQTRRTRISKRLEDSRDKTEFWMPAFPWRAIDYLNYKGSDVEGLYRVPGSGPQIKRWQRRFDEELDIDLFEQGDLYDINIIGSMLKAWLRELPDELFPKVAQDRISRESVGSENVPQLLIDELSNLPPFNYYLLFAITCHLSLLLAHSEKNKMDYRNLCICFQPCMKIDAFCFKFLVCNWRDCWKGCKTEARHIEEEYRILDERERGDRPPNSAEGRSSTAVESHDERNVSSSDSSKPSSVSVDKDGKWIPAQAKGDAKIGEGKGGSKKLPLSQSQSSGTVNTTLTVVQEKTPPRRSADMRPLSPIAPLSPIGL